MCVLQDWYVALVKSQCCLKGDGALYETTELLTKLPQSDLNTIMTCKVKTKYMYKIIIIAIRYIYTALFWVLKALYMEEGNLLISLIL